MEINKFVRSRPFLYHLTDRANRSHILATNEMSPAAVLMEHAGRPELVRTRRRQHERIVIGDTVILLRDQAPLQRGNIELLGGHIFEDVIENINRRIFFWPGTATGPINYGIRHFERYREEEPVILRLRLESLLDSNPEVEPKFCSYNSGSPRCSNGVKSPRGPNTFVTASEFVGTPSRVVEVTFESPLVLPVDAEVADHPNGPWRLLSQWQIT